MTQIKKTLSIAGIIALATAPAMADIASTDYVQSIVNNVIPKTGTVGHVLKKTATGLEWAAAPSVPEGVLINNAADSEYGDIAIGEDAIANDSSIAIGRDASGSEQSVAIGDGAAASMGAAAIGYGAKADGYGSIQLGAGKNTADSTFSVALMDIDYNTTNYRLLNPAGNIPAGRMVAGTWDDDEGMYVDNNGTAGQLLQTNGDGTMSWVNAPSAPTLASLLPELPSACNTVKCALVHDNADGAYKWEVVKVSE